MPSPYKPYWADGKERELPQWVVPEAMENRAFVESMKAEMAATMQRLRTAEALRLLEDFYGEDDV